VRKLLPPLETFGWLQSWTTKTDASGAYSLELGEKADAELEKAVTIDIDIVAPRHADYFQKFSISSARRHNDVERRLPDALLTSAPFEFVGRCENKDKSPIAKARVLAILVGRDKNGSENQALCRPRFTDSDGKFSLPMAGNEISVELAIYSDNHAPRYLSVEPKAGQTHEVVLESGAIAKGHVLGISSEPLPGYCVVATATGNSASQKIPLRRVVQTDQEGAFRFSPLLGEYEVAVWPHFYPWMTEEPLTSPKPMLAINSFQHRFGPEEKDLDVELHAMKSLDVSGILFGPTKKPIRSHSVAAYSVSGKVLDVVRTDENGTYRLGGIPSDTRQVRIIVIGCLDKPAPDGTLLLAKPISNLDGTIGPDGSVTLELSGESVAGLNFQFCRFKSPEGFLSYDDESLQKATTTKPTKATTADLGSTPGGDNVLLPTLSLCGFAIVVLIYHRRVRRRRSSLQ
jgi:hypothetical protein